MAMSDVLTIDPLPGNWLASQLRIHQEDTQSLLHHRRQSRESNHRPGPFFSHYELDFGGPGSKVRVIDGSQGVIRDKQGRALNLFSRGGDYQPSKMFMNWKVPKRLLEDKKPSVSQRSQRGCDRQMTIPVTPLQLDQNKQKSYETEAIQRQLMPEMISQLSLNPAREFDVDGPQPRETPLAEYKLHDRVRSSHSIASRLPDIRKPMTAVPCARPIAQSPNKPKSAALVKTHTPQTAQVNYDVPKQPVWKQVFPKKVIEKAIRQSNRFATEDNVLNKALLPDAKMAALKWMDQATESDRQTALTFFQSLAGTKLMGTTSDEQIQRLDQVLNALNTGRAIGVGMLPRYQRQAVGRHSDNELRLQYLRLLSPDTRKHRVQHTTWHHLPLYHDTDKVENRTAIYTEPHKAIPRHYVVHPDLG